MKATWIPLLAAACAWSFARLAPDQPQDAGAQETRPRMVDAMGTVTVTSGAARGGAPLIAPGNAGIWIRIRNWDPVKNLESIEGVMGFFGGDKIRVTEARARRWAPGQAEGVKGPTAPAEIGDRGVITVRELRLEPGEAVDLYIMYSAAPSGPCGFSFEAKY